MRKTLVIAIREYLAAVKTRSFLISVIVLPIMMFSGVIAQGVGEKFKDLSDKHVAIIDRTPDATLSKSLSAKIEQYNTNGIKDAFGQQARSKFELEKIEPAPANTPAADEQRLKLSDRVRSGALLAFVEFAPETLLPTTQPTRDATAPIQYTTNRPAYRDFTNVLTSTITPAAPRIGDRGLAERLPDGSITYEPKTKQIANLMVPLLLMALMFVLVLVGATPMTANIIEEKTLRIAEVLLGSVTPSQLMAGKLLGGVAVALTLAVIYCGGAYAVAATQGMTSLVPTGIILWFVFFTIVGTLMYGSMFLAAGAAVTNLKESQTMIMPVMVLIMLPIMMSAGSLINDPSGRIATIASLFPFSAPMVMIARIAIPPGVPAWQALLGAGSAIIATCVLVWAAGRIFRVGILVQGQAATYAQVLKWIFRG